MGPGAFLGSHSHTVTVDSLSYTIVIANRVNVVPHYIQLNVSSTQLPLTKPRNSPNHYKTAPRECVTEGSLAGERAVNTLLGPLSGAQEGPKQVRGPEASSFISIFVSPYLNISSTLGTCLERVIPSPFPSLPPVLSLPQTFILVHTIFQTPC